MGKVIKFPSKAKQVPSNWSSPFGTGHPSFTEICDAWDDAMEKVFRDATLWGHPGYYTLTDEIKLDALEPGEELPFDL